MAKNSLTLQINSLEALEKLIGGDTQVEIDIRNNIVQAFAEKHLKALAGSQQINNAIVAVRASVENEVQAELKRLFGEYQNKWRQDIRLDDKVKTIIKEAVSSEIRLLVSSHLKEIMATPDWIKDNIEKYVKTLSTNIFQSEIQTKISNTVKFAIDEQVSKLKLTFNISKGE